MPDSGLAYLRCSGGEGPFDEMVLDFRNYEGNVVTGFFNKGKVLGGSLLEVEVIEEEGDKVSIALPYYHCHIFSGGKRHVVNRSNIVYGNELKN